jgi:uncharacterized Zn-finger protein
VIEIGAHEFMCEAKWRRFDHPHVYLDMATPTEIICPYCSTLFRLDPTLDPHAARPAECALADGVTPKEGRDSLYCRSGARRNDATGTDPVMRGQHQSRFGGGDVDLGTRRAT